LNTRRQHGFLTPLLARFKRLTRQNYILYNPAVETTCPDRPLR
jgi:hypothetical protein